MFKAYVKTAWRNIRRTPGYSSLNILGLAIGMGVALLIGLWVYDQYSYDRSLPDNERLYRVQRNFDSNGDTLTFLTTSLKLAEVLRTQIPEIEYVAESDWMGSHGLMAGDRKIYQAGGTVGSDFLKMFQFPLVQGNAGVILNDPYSIVLTQSTATALFGTDDPMGKMVRFDNSHDLKVTGILKDLPANSSFSFNFLVPFSYLDQTQPDIKNRRTGSFGGNGYQIFVKLKRGAEYGRVYAKIRDIEHTEKGNRNAMNSYVTLQPLLRWHLYSNYKNGEDQAGFLEYVRMFSIIGILVLLIACINFINLTTARSERRAREVGVRKAIGSRRIDLIIQFLTESFFLTLISFAFSMILVQLALPPFNTLTGSKITMPYGSIVFWIAALVFVVITALIAGSRPAFYLSSFQPVKVLKGALQIGKAASWPRRIMVVLQFTCSVAFIISTIIVYRQIQYAKNRPSGYELNRLVQTEASPDLHKNFTALKNELLQTGVAESVTSATSPATDIHWHMDIDNWPGKHPGETVEMGAIQVCGDYFKTMGMVMKEGRDFEVNDTSKIILNEMAVRRLRLKDPVGQVMTLDDRPFRIIGVVKDALMLSPFAGADPTMFAFSPEEQGNILYRLSARMGTQEAVSRSAAIFNKYNPAFPYSYTFADERYAAKFKLEVLIGKLAGLFAGLAIFISCLGLLGLAAYVAERRTKEIGIRKVLGASVSQVWLLLTKDFLLLVVVSCVIASPLAFYFLHGWLAKYDYRISIGAGVFILAGLMAVVLTILTISFQAIRAATENPVKKLRAE
ncbi:ABC transporter permease [Flavitalea sp. BT771]|uniref:ABC transporter permease n=1 Tax=Flavitalea sp. BT771 TaxID=3063329 RepID=UPI0026E2CAE3|nr:ABC transporter permease [Flavitalea sp. BT771]MDO6435160.1 ABC transporter permease [Flavitalea sp. BT771]MDV6224135.1 ABC transporter permease [Flavitalea sp. BT771]